MDLLPDLALLEVFSFVSVEERFKALRLVCKRWKQVVEFQTQPDLVVYEDEHPFKNRWPSDNRQIDPLSAVGKPFFVFSLINGHYKAIRSLFLYQFDSTGFDRQWLREKLMDCMCQLEELSIDQLNWSMKSLNFFDLDGLTLPNLRVLSVKQYFNAIASITAPKLEKLVLWDLYSINNSVKGPMISLSHPERLKSFQCQLIGKGTQAYSNLVELCAHHVKRDFHLSFHPKLKRLDLCISPCLFLRNTEDFHQTIEVLLEQKRKLKLDDLEITNFGTRGEVFPNNYSIHNQCAVFCIWFYGGALDGFVENFTVDFLPWEIYCHGLVYQHKGSSALCRSRLNIKFVRVDQKERPDPNLLIRFLVEIGGVRQLSIDRCPLGQEFYDQLPTVPYIAILHTRGHLLVTDFEFISRIRFLNRTWLMVKHSAVDSLWEAFRRSKIKRFWIKFSDEGMKSWKFNSPQLELEQTKFIMTKTGHEKTEFHCLNAAFEAFKKEIEKS